MLSFMQTLIKIFKRGNMDLRHYLFENRITNKNFAELLGVTIVYVGEIKNGKKKPSIPVAMKMIELSKGEITPKDIYPELFETYEKTTKEV